MYVCAQAYSTIIIWILEMWLLKMYLLFNENAILHFVLDYFNYRMCDRVADNCLGDKNCS